jgi:hypothetical protein
MTVSRRACGLLTGRGGSERLCKDLRMNFGPGTNGRGPSLPIEEGLPMEAKLTKAA